MRQPCRRCGKISTDALYHTSGADATYFVMLMLSVANFLNNGMDQYFVFQNAFNKAHIQVLDLYVYNIGMTGSSFLWQQRSVC